MAPPPPQKQRLLSYYRPVRRRASHRYSVPSVFGLGRLPLAGRVAVQAQMTGRLYRCSPSHVLCKSRRPGSRRLYAGHHLASKRVSARLIPEGAQKTSGFDAVSFVSTPQRRTPRRSPEQNASGTSSWSLPDASSAPFPCRSPRRSSANAAQGGLAPAPEGRRWRANDPPSLTQHCFLRSLYT